MTWSEIARKMMQIPRNLEIEDFVEIYRWLILSRKFDEAWVKLFSEQKALENPHSNRGQEAVAVGSLYSLRKDDYVVPSLRTRPALIMRGVPLEEQFSGIMGKATGHSKGKSTSHHMGDNQRGIIGTTGLVGSHLPIATGVALANKLRGANNVTLCFFGDGASNRGDFHEALNFAAVKQLPVIFVIENNEFGEWTRLRDHVRIKNLSDRAIGYGFPGVSIDGNDVLKVHDTVDQAVTRARRGDGPTLVECQTYRLRDHCEGFPDGRPKEEIAMWSLRDPVENFERFIVDKGFVTQGEILKIKSEVQMRIDRAIEYSINSPWPDPEISITDVYAPPYEVQEKQILHDDLRQISMGTALNEALREELARDKRVFLIGEDIGGETIGPGIPTAGGVWPPTEGLWKEFPDRVINTPISESEIAGAAAGAAMVGMRPVAEIMYADFLAISMDQIANTAAKMRFNYGGDCTMPMVIRCAFGAIGEGMHHSQSTEAWLMNVPGLQLVMPSNAYDAKGLLKTCIRGDNPTVFFEHKRLYPAKSGVPAGEYLIPLGKAVVKRQGRDATIVATGLMVQRAMSAAEKIGMRGIEAEVIDPRTLRPLDTRTIVHSVRKTGKLVVVHEAPKFGGFGAEIVSQVVENALDYMDAPAVRVTAPETPVPFSTPLENNYVPTEKSIIAAIEQIVG
jgi:2-oxoisovalerate dehydrogenase E1 component